MSDIKLKAALPKDSEANGLKGQAIADLFDEANKPVVVIGVLQTAEVTEDRASLSRVPKVVFTRIEPVLDGEDASNLVERMQALADERGGVVQLPVPSSDALDFDGPDAA